MADTTSRPATPTKSTPTLTSALASSIRHHARIIDGREAPKQLPGLSIPHPSYDEEQVTLSTSTERGFESEAKLAVETRQFEGIRDTALLNFVSNPQGEATVRNPNVDAAGGRNDPKISSWFRPDDTRKDKTVRFATDSDNFTSMITGNRLPKQWGRSNFIAPPPTSFRVATRHPSQGYYQPGVSRSSLQNRKRNDQLMRLIVFILCFGISLTFVLFLVNGKWDDYMSSVVTSRPIIKDSKDDELELFYPSWWRDEKPIPDMEDRNVELSGVAEFNGWRSFVRQSIENIFITALIHGCIISRIPIKYLLKNGC